MFSSCALTAPVGQPSDRLRAKTRPRKKSAAGLIIFSIRRHCRNDSNLEPLAVFAADVLVGFLGVRHLHVDGVPFNSLSGTQRHVAEQHRLGQPAGIREIRQGQFRLAFLDGMANSVKWPGDCTYSGFL